jgi:hypothetical protein
MKLKWIEEKSFYANIEAFSNFLVDSAVDFSSSSPHQKGSF